MHSHHSTSLLSRRATWCQLPAHVLAAWYTNGRTTRAQDAVTRKPLAASDVWAYESVDGTAVAMDPRGALQGGAAAPVDHICMAWVAASPTTSSLWKRVRTRG
jgi:hypothetical protein